MSTGTKTTAGGAKGKTKDYITQIKKETEGQKDAAQIENEDNDWHKYDSEEEEAQTGGKKGVVVEQGKVGTDKPKKLGDLFSDAPKQTRSFKPTG